MVKGKKKQPGAPSFSDSQIMYGDQVVGKTYKKGNQIITQYMPDPAEVQRKNLANQRINQLLPSLGQTAPEISQQYDQMSNAYIDQATEKFNNQYNPALRNLREDIGSRFGTLQATPYFDQLQSMEKNVRTPALLDIVRQGTMMKQDLYDQDQSRKLRELSALGYSLNQNQQDFLNNLRSPLESSQLINQYNQNNYTQQLQSMQNQRSGNAALFGPILSMFAR